MKTKADSSMNSPMKAIATTMVSVVALLMAVSATQAAVIPVANAGFENPVLADGTHNGSGNVPSWTATAAPEALVFNLTAAQFPPGAPEGFNVLFLDGNFANWGVKASATQTGFAVIDEGSQYELKLKVGGNPPGSPFGDYTVSLLKDASIAASISNYGGGTGPTVVVPSWVDVTLLYTPVAGDAGKSLGILLESGISGGSGAVTLIDDVQLFAVAVPVPEPNTALLAGAGALLLVWRARRK